MRSHNRAEDFSTKARLATEQRGHDSCLHSTLHPLIHNISELLHRSMMTVAKARLGIEDGPACPMESRGHTSGFTGMSVEAMLGTRRQTHEPLKLSLTFRGCPTQCHCSSLQCGDMGRLRGCEADRETDTTRTERQEVSLPP